MDLDAIFSSRHSHPQESESDLVRHRIGKMRDELLTCIGDSRYETLVEILYQGNRPVTFIGFRFTLLYIEPNPTFFVRH